MNVEIYELKHAIFGRVIFWMREDVYDFLKAVIERFRKNMQDYN